MRDQCRKRVVVTGMGIWSCIGQDLPTVAESLRQGRSGIIFDASRVAYGLQSGLVGDVPRPDLKPLLARKYRTTINEETAYAYMAARQALRQAGMGEDYLLSHEVGAIFGTDGNSSYLEAHKIMQDERSSIMLGPYYLYKSLTSSVTINLSTIFHLSGVCFCVGAACSSSAHALGLATMLIRSGIQSAILVGGAMEISPLSMAANAEALGILSRRNTNPEKASRPFDAGRDGMVMSGGASALVLEEYEHAVARGANVLAEVVGYGFSSNGIEDISASSSQAEYIAMKRALDDADLSPEDIDYVNAHATSTKQGDIEEAIALSNLFSNQNTLVSSTKAITGHELHAAGANEVIYSILMMQNGFVAPNINLENVIDEAKDLNIVRKTIYAPINFILSNSSGLGGTNSAIVLKKYEYNGTAGN